MALGMKPDINNATRRPQCSFSLTGLYIHHSPPHPPSCPPPSYTITHSAGHPSLFTFTPYCPPPPYTTTNSAGHPTFLLSYLTVHLPPIQPPTQLDTLPAYLPLPSYFPTFLLSYFPTLTVHLLPILSLTQLDTPLPSHSHTTCPVSTSSLYYHSLGPRSFKNTHTHTQLDTLPAYLPLPSYFPTFILLLSTSPPYTITSSAGHPPLAM
jgi:hypothetical protein